MRRPSRARPRQLADVTEIRPSYAASDGDVPIEQMADTLADWLLAIMAREDREAAAITEVGSGAESEVRP